MIYEIYTENGTKKKRALTGNGYGLPLGTWISANGQIRYTDENKLSDFENIGTGTSLNTQGYNSSSNAFVCPYDGEVYFTFYSGTDDGVFAIHIIDSVGTDKKLENGSTATYNSKVFVLQVKKGDKIYSDDTRGIASYARWYKRHLAIKATPAYVEPDTVSDMVNTLRTQDSYSTSEVNTGKKWIDGKPIYRKVFYSDSWVDNSSLDASALNIDDVTSLRAMWLRQDNWFEAPYIGAGGFFSTLYYNTSTGLIRFEGSISHAGAKNRTIIEYTKTTD